MTAPAAPRIRGHCSGSVMSVYWHTVEDATDYNLYVADEDTTAGIEAQFDESDAVGNWFHYAFRPLGSDVEVYVTALNAGAEESDPSNTKAVKFTASPA